MLRPVIAVDLAVKFSAGVVLTEDGDVLTQWDSTQRDNRALAGYIVALKALIPKAVVVLEDVPPKTANSSILKSVCQLQGRIIQAMPEASLYDTYFVPPHYWQSEMGVFRSTPEETAQAAAALGYSPPDLLASRGLTEGQRGKSAQIREARKQMTDYVDAFLIATWAQGYIEQGKTWDSKRVKYYAR